MTGFGQALMAKIITDAQSDTNVKVILLHGGKYFSSGNNLTNLKDGLGNPEAMQKYGKAGIFEGMNPYLNALADSNKPTVAIVRGGALGIAFTMLNHVDFLFCAPDAHFMVPFMKTF
jgi:enoyl-CoA hydratase/carnithine racemase